MQPTVNRYLKDKAMDNIDHALGRPSWPMRETYRNNFSCDPDSKEAIEFRASPNWSETKTFPNMNYFYVNDAGRKALVKHLKQIGDQNRVFDVTYMGYTTQVVATTASKARYSHFLDISDALPDTKFDAFCKATKVAVTTPNQEAAS